MSIVKKKVQLTDTILNFNYNFIYSSLITSLINDGSIDELVGQINNTKTNTDINSLIKKDDLSGNEQFVIILNDFIIRFKEDFYFLKNNVEYLIEVLLKNKNHARYILCKNYIGNNNFINYFNFNYKAVVIYGFYNNIKILTKRSDLIRIFVRDHNINLQKNLMYCKDNVEKLYDILIKMTMCNAKNFNIPLLFEDITDYKKKKVTNSLKKNTEFESSVMTFYVIQWELMVKNYYEKIDIINVLF